jgi:hypothetical protein
VDSGRREPSTARSSHRGDAQKRAGRVTAFQKPQWCCWLMIAAGISVLSPAGTSDITFCPWRVKRVQSGVSRAVGLPV